MGKEDDPYGAVDRTGITGRPKGSGAEEPGRPGRAKKILPPTTPAERALLERERRRFQGSLMQFILGSWHIVEPGTVFCRGKHIDAIVEHLEAAAVGIIRHLVINIPPRFGKSNLTCVFYPAWVWTWKPDAKFLFASYGQHLATRDSVKCRRIIKSRWYQQHWGHLFKLTGDQNAKIRFENNRTGHRIATSVGGTGTGEGGDFVVVDDALKVSHAHSLSRREKANNWWNEEMSTRGNDPKTAVYIVVGQRVHEEDLPGTLLAEDSDDDYDLLCLPMRHETDRKIPPTSLGWVDWRTEEGELLWPARFPEEEVVRLEHKLGTSGTAGQLQQRPAPREGMLIKRGWWKRYSRPPATFDMLLQSWDMSFKDKKTSSYVVGQLWGRLGAAFYLLAQVRERMDLPTTIQAMRDATNGWRHRYGVCLTKLVEDKANGSGVISTLQRELPGMIPINPRGNKVSRLHAVSPTIEAGNVWLPEPEIAPWIDMYLQEFGYFPNGRFDDQVDATTQALSRLVEDVDTVAFSPLGRWMKDKVKSPETNVDFLAGAREQFLKRMSGES